MKINSITLGFMGAPAGDLGKVKALKPLELDGVKVQSKNASAKRFNSEKSMESRDEFIMSHAQKASEIAEQRAKENPDIPFDDLFQEEMLKVIEYADRRMRDGGTVSCNHPDRIIARTAETYEPPQDEFIRDLKPAEAVDRRDLEDIVSLKDAQATVDDAVSELTPRQERIVHERFGFDGDPKTYKEIGDEYGVSPERIRGIETKALQRLRHPSRSRELRNCLKTYDNQ